MRTYQEQTNLDELQAQSIPRPRLHYRSVARSLRETFDTVIWVAVLFALVNLATARFVVEGASMEPNFHTGEYILVSRLSYLLGDPQRGDIVVFHYPNNPQQDYIKRVIGRPGDTVEIRDRLVYVNGEALNEPYINEACTNSCSDRVWEIGADEFFVMGDNRNHSSDSRAFGVVNRQFIVGEALLRYWPLNQIGSVMDIAYPKE
ncbi:MAG: signal peptidase I [Anaerolineae bacterium]|nr:signal peptidase I [Anaerolineae bacterium]NUQ05975.1 signal peptidase I [Anaerolineae bacterium]